MDNSNTSSASSFLKRCGFPQFLFMRLLGIYFFLSDILIFYAANKKTGVLKNWTKFIGMYSFPVLVLIYVLLFAGVSVLFYFMPKKFRAFTECFDPILLIVSVIVFSCALSFRSDDFFLGVITGLFAVVMVIYGASKMHPERLNSQKNDWFTAVPVLAVAIFLIAFVWVTSVAIHKSFGTATFDMGIFTQMFHSLKTKFTAVTTCERGVALSHFRIHGSYILYLLLPVYAIFPSAETLIISQVFLVISGVIPTYLLGKKKGFQGASLFSLCMIYLFFLGLLAPCYFHFHENAFLPPLLMWLFYAIESRNNKLFYVMSFLVCMVKEDATLFVICICLYLAFEQKGKDRRRALITGGAALLYFILMSIFLTKIGDGEMMTSTRMNTLMTAEDQGVFEILKNILINPGHALTVFSHQEASFQMLLQMMFPLLFMPFFTKKTHRFFLMIPFLLFNLVFGAAYIYASQITYHYAFGTSALLIYMAVLNISEMEKDKKYMILLACGAVSVITAFAMISGNMSKFEKYLKNEKKYQNIEACLQTIPEDASVSCDTKYLPHIAQRDEIYSINSDSFVLSGPTVVKLVDVGTTDYIVLDMKDDRQRQAKDILISSGYTEFASAEDTITILVLQEKK